MKETLSGKYIVILALTAVAILVIGGLFRPRPAQPEAPSPTETAILQQSVRREQAAGIGQYLASRAADLADQAVFLPSRKTSGVRYEKPTQVLTVAAKDELLEPVLAVAETSMAVSPAPLDAATRNPDHWVLIIGRSPGDQPLWTAAIQGTADSAVCNGVPYQELVLNVALDPSFTGAGAFDLNGSLLGIAMPCGGALHIVSAASVPALLALSTSPDREFMEKFGLRATQLPDQWRDLYPRLKGFLVTDVWTGMWADRNGIVPGDLILNEEETLNLANIGTEVKIAKPGRAGLVVAKVDQNGPGTGVEILPAAPPLPELRVGHGTPAERAGLRTGDRLVSVLGRRDTSLSALSKLLAEPGPGPVRMVYQRGRKRSLVEVPHE